MTEMTRVDWTIVIVMLLSVLAGLSQGFLRAVFSLGGLFMGLALAAWNYPLLAAPLKSLLHSEEIANIVAFIAIALLVMALSGIVGALLSKTVHKLGLGCLDRIAGGVFGFFQGMLLVTLVILVTIAFYPQARWLVDSRLPRGAARAVGPQDPGRRGSCVVASPRGQVISFKRYFVPREGHGFRPIG
jgi:membrane protein required for colicin V production